MAKCDADNNDADSKFYVAPGGHFIGWAICDYPL